MIRLLRRVHQDESGVSLLLVAAGMAAFIGIAAIVIDIGMAMSQGRLDQNAADFAALAAANDAYLGITQMEAAAQGISDDNLGELVPLTGCSAELIPPGSPFFEINGCMSVAPYGLNTPDNWVGQTWVGVPDQTSGPFFGPSIDTRRDAAAAILPREGGPLAPLAVGSATSALACLDLTNPDVNAGCTTPLSLVSSPRCTPSVGDPFVVNMLNGIDHLIAQHDGTGRPDNCVTPGSNQLTFLPGDPLETVEALLAGGFLSDGGQLGLDAGIGGACGGTGTIGETTDCIGSLINAAALDGHYYYVPVVSGSSVTQFAGLYIAGVGWETVEGVPDTGILELAVNVTYDTALHDSDEFQCQLLPESGAFDIIGPWNDACIGPGGLGRALYPIVSLLPPGGMTLPAWENIWLDYLRFDNRQDFLQLTAYVLPADALPDELVGVGIDVNPYEVDGLIQ